MRSAYLKLKPKSGSTLSSLEIGTFRLSDESVWVIVVAGGEGRRYGGHKQFARLNGTSVLGWSLRAASTVADGIVVVLPPSVFGNPDDQDSLPIEIGNGGPVFNGPVKYVAGGKTRSESVRAGLVAVPDEAEVVLVHDAARPLASPALFEAVLRAVRSGFDGAICAVPVADTVKRCNSDGSLTTLDRSELVAVQTPQGFKSQWLRTAHESEPEATDDAALVEAIGGRVTVVAGEATNTKITSPEDMMIIQLLCQFGNFDFSDKTEPGSSGQFLFAPANHRFAEETEPQ